LNIQPLSGGNIPGTGRATESFPKTSLNGETLVANSEEQSISNSTMKVMLSDLKGLLQLRSDLVESLPTPIKQIVQNIFQNFSGADQVSQGLTVLSKNQTDASEKLLMVVSLLHETTRLQQMPAANQKKLLNQEMNRSIELLQRMGLPTTYQLDDLPVDQLKKAADSVQELALSVQKSASPNGLSSSSNQIFSFALPLFFFGNPRPYPTYVHVYNEDKQFVGTTEKKETWIRLCIDTENIGLVDIAFQMVQNQADDQVNLRVLFDTTGAADSFVEYLSDLRSVFDRLSLKLNDVAVKAPHEGKNG